MLKLQGWQQFMRAQFPKMSGVYSAGMDSGRFELALTAAGITDNPLRFAAFLATVAVESGDLRFIRENMNYTAAQIKKVFGVGKHSAGITDAEANVLAKKPEALAERVYGLGNPKKARELGNTVKGDGFAYRGTGPFQHTGKKIIHSELRRLGLSKIEDLIDPNYIFLPAVQYWKENGLNQLADMGDTRAIRKRVNGGYNGYSHFKRIYDKLVTQLSDGQDEAAIAQVNQSVVWVQTTLNSLGYDLVVDGKQGPKTEAAIRAFQKVNGLKADGIAGAVTKAMMETRLEVNSPVVAPDLPILSNEAKQATGAGAVGIGAVGGVINDAASQISALGLDNPWIQAIPPVLIVIGLGFMLWSFMSGKKDD